MARARHNNRSGYALIYITIAFVVLCGFVSLGVDLGRVQLVKTELRQAADASARAGAAYLESDTTTIRNQTIAWAAQNTSEGTPIALQTADVEIGKWANNTFTLTSGSDRNAVRVTAQRTAARGNAVSLLFAKLVGREYCDVKAVAIASKNPPLGYAIIGLDWVHISGTGMTDSWNSNDGAYSAATKKTNGDVASNGPITFTGTSSYIWGDAYAGMGQTPADSSHVFGSNELLNYQLNFPTASAGSVKNHNDNSLVSSSYFNSSTRDYVQNSGSYTLPAGKYYFNNVTINGPLSTSGPVTIYVTGALTITSFLTPYQNLAKNARIRVTSTNSGLIDLTGNRQVYVDLYAPYANVDIGGTGDMYGVVVAKTVSINGTGDIHYDEALPAYYGDSNICLVK